jgi:hypothetical protein
MWHVYETSTGTLLYSCSYEQNEQAYAMAAFYEEQGLDVHVTSPKITQTLADALGASSEEHECLEKSIHHEISEHLPD